MRSGVKGNQSNLLWTGLVDVCQNPGIGVQPQSQLLLLIISFSILMTSRQLVTEQLDK